MRTEQIVIHVVECLRGVPRDSRIGGGSRRVLIEIATLNIVSLKKLVIITLGNGE